VAGEERGLQQAQVFPVRPLVRRRRERWAPREGFVQDRARLVRAPERGHRQRPCLGPHRDGEGRLEPAEVEEGAERADGDEDGQRLR
jgi:hypothetical protein